MFFHEKIRSIKRSDYVLDVGPGYTPFYRSDVLLEKVFDDDKVALKQTGSSKKVDLKKKIVYFSEDNFPFEDGEFDYVICSHVLEHIPKLELPHFFKEFQRVSSRGGYVEVPSYIYELFRNIELHLSLVYADQDNKLHFLYKEDLDLESRSYKMLKELLVKFGINSRVIGLNHHVFGYGFEHKNDISYEIHEDADSFFSMISDEISYSYIKLNKDVGYYYMKILRQFEPNVFKQKIYNRLKISLK
ncbi:MAG: methyltransferase domain-containing protein [Sulfuricurvum sp.]